VDDRAHWACANLWKWCQFDGRGTEMVEEMVDSAKMVTGNEIPHMTFLGIASDSLYAEIRSLSPHLPNRPSYNRLMRRVPLVALLLAGVFCAAQEPKKPAEQQEQQPPEEDESLKPKEYSFNPLEAEHDVQIGNYYFKKGNLKAAMNRFREATRWNPSSAEAFLRLGDTEEKLKDKQGAREAYTKYLELAPDGKEVEAVKKKLAGKR
jgi:tetratricopeptide (TPR) repeat protein